MEEIPYKCHVIVCVNDRQGQRKSCADGNSQEIRQRLKEAIASRGWPKNDVRVSQGLCLGLCQSGPNVMIYPENILFSHVTLEDLPSILEKVEGIMAETNNR